MAEKIKRNPNNFFKIMFGDFVNNLRIPPMFVENVFKGNVPAKFTLESDSGTGSGGSWRVRVERKEDGFFFCGGWSSFVKDHSLEFGDFLHFFLVDDGSRFYVVICDRTACSKYIGFPAKRPRGPDVVNRQIEEKDSKRFASCPKVARGVSAPGRRISGAIDERAKNFGQKSEILSEVTPDRHPSCQVIVKNYDRHNIRVPRAFSEETCLAKEKSTVIKDSKGREWPMNIFLERDRNDVRLSCGWSKFKQENNLVAGDTLLFKRVPNTGNSIHVQFISRAEGGSFRKQNKRPNACQINNNPAAKRPQGQPVVNRRIEETPSTNCASAGKVRKGSQKIEFESEVVSEHPSFEVVVKQEYQKQFIVVPRSFVEETGLAKEKSTVIKDPNGRMWPVKVVVPKGSKGATLSAGWTKFVQENKIVIGDTLFLKHIPNTGNSIDVQVIKKAEDENSGRQKKRPNSWQMNTNLAAKRQRYRYKVNRQIEETPSKNCASRSKTRGVSNGRARTGREANGSKEIEFISEENPEHPSFIVVLKEHQKRCVTVPSSFAKELGWVKRQSTAIMDPEGRKWQLNVRLNSKSSKSAYLRVRLVGGWPKFLRENKIVVGDTLLIEHIPYTGNLIRFKIISKARRRNERK